MSTPQDMARLGYYSVAKVAQACDVTEDTVRRWVRSGTVSSRRVGKGGRDTPSIYISAESVMERNPGLAEVIASRLGFERLSGMEPHPRFRWGSEALANAFIEGCRNFAPAGTQYKIRSESDRDDEWGVIVEVMIGE